MIRRKAPSRPVEAPPRPPWTKAVGQPASFYHEGGHGDKYWVRGWRYGFIRAIPIKGRYKNWIQMEIPVKLWTWNADKLKGKIGWVEKPMERAWVFSANVNAPGDCIYHGPSLQEIVQERKAAKVKDIAKAKRRVKAP